MGFRGDGTSVTSAMGLPVRWSPSDGIAWKAAIPGYGQSNPLIWKNHVYVTSVDGQNKEMGLVTALDLQGGRVLWQKPFATSQKMKQGPMTSRAAPTGTVDDERVVALFETGDLLAIDHAGNELWKRSLTEELGKWDNNHGMASSLAQDAVNVFVLADHRGSNPWLMAINKATGRTTWKVDRKPVSSWTSPVYDKLDGQPTVLVSSSGSLDAYSALDGKLLWHLEGFTGNTIPSPVVAGDRVILGAGENRMKPDLAASAKSNGAVRIEKGQPKLDWGTQKVILQHASPIVHKGIVYFTTKAGMIHAHDLIDGKELFTQRLSDPCWATPIAAGNNIYFFGKNGLTTVIESGPLGKRLAINRIWDEEEHQKRKIADEKKPENQIKPGESKKVEHEKKKQPESTPGKTLQANDREVKKSNTNQTQNNPPAMPPDRARSMGNEAVGDVVYGIAAVDGQWLIRTGTELICIRHGAK
jgi:outer membrane protein assembly factor BamB